MRSSDRDNGTDVTVKWGKHYILTLPHGTVVLGKIKSEQVSSCPSLAPMVFHPVWGLGQYQEKYDDQIFYKFNNTEKHNVGVVKT